MSVNQRAIYRRASSDLWELVLCQVNLHTSKKNQQLVFKWRNPGAWHKGKTQTAYSDVSAAVGAGATCGGPQISESGAAFAVETLVMSRSPTDVSKLQSNFRHPQGGGCYWGQEWGKFIFQRPEELSVFQRHNIICEWLIWGTQLWPNG